MADKAQISSPVDTHQAITSADLRQLTDHAVLELLTHGSVFSRLLADDKLRLVEVAKTAGRHIVVAGSTLTDLPASERADVTIQLPRRSFHSLYAAIERSRTSAANTQNALR